MKIIVFGHKGMLGSYVYAWMMSKGYDVVGIGREQVDALIIDSMGPLIDLIYQNANDDKVIAINCIGIIRPASTTTGLLHAIKVNSLFPWLLACACEETLIRLIHITTDCVFSGNTGNYKESDIPDPINTYGLSKVAGEPLSATIIRTSIIGEELRPEKRSLIEYVKSREHHNIDGYMNHWWNGITCLQLAKIIDNIIDTDNMWKGVRHIHSNYVLTKCALVKYLARTYLKDYSFTEKNVNPINRSLASEYEFTFGLMPDIFTQIDEQKLFYNTLKLYYNV